MNGAFDFNKTPLAPHGTRVIAHDKPKTRTSWGSHGLDGWYIGHAPNHYRCYTVHINNTRRDRIADT
eukprot:6565110-Ditylum_brightwellii.AAC.1